MAVYFTTEDVLAQEPETVEAFRAAIEKSLQFAQDNPDEVRAVLPSYTQLDEELIDQLVLPAYPTEVNRQSVQELADLAAARTHRGGPGPRGAARVSAPGEVRPPRAGAPSGEARQHLVGGHRAPGPTASSRTVPARGADTRVSVFMASSTATS